MSTPSQSAADRWNRTFKYFRFHYALGGHANDMDYIVATVCFARGEAGLLDLFTRLEIPLAKANARQGATPRAASQHAEPIPAYPDYLAPGMVTLFGAHANLTVRADQMDILLFGANDDLWSVTKRDFANARMLERVLPQRGVTFRARATIEQTQRLFLALSENGLPDLPSYEAARSGASLTEANVARAADDVRARLEALRHALGPEFAHDHVWREAHEEIHAIRANAIRLDGHAGLLAHRFPGYGTSVLEIACAHAVRAKG